MDHIDRSIVKLLQRDGRMSHESIAREVHLSRPAVHDRIRRMEAAGVIQGYTAQIDWEAMGLPVTAFIQARVSGNCYPTAQTILGLVTDEALVENCHRIAGDWCLLIQTRSASPLALQGLLDEIRSVPGVQSTMTTVALSTVLREAKRLPAESAGAKGARK